MELTEFEKILMESDARANRINTALRALESPEATEHTHCSGTEKGKTTAIKSDGGSSKYYDTELPNWFIDRLIERRKLDGQAHIKDEEIIEIFFGNDFDYGNAYKSLRRSFGTENGGGKEGNTVDYEMNKVIYSANKIKNRNNR